MKRLINRGRRERENELREENRASRVSEGGGKGSGLL